MAKKKKKEEEGFVPQFPRRRTVLAPRGEGGVVTTETGKGRVIEAGGEKITVAPGEQVITQKRGRGQRVIVGDPRDPNIARFPRTQVDPETGMVTTIDPEIATGQVPEFIPMPQTQEELQQLRPSGQLLEAGAPLIEQTISGILERKEAERLFAEQEAREAGVEAPERGAIEKVAGIGTFIPTSMANIISKGLNLIGVDIGTISNKEFAATNIGKVLGLTTVAAATVAGGYYAFSLIPAGAIGSLTPAAAAKVAIAAPAVKTGMFSTIASSKLLKACFVGGIVVSAINGRISDLETSIVNQRETITLIGSGVQTGIISPQEALLMLNDLEEDINKSESAIHQTALVSYKSWLGKGKEVETRVQKARSQLIVERGRIANFMTGGGGEIR